MSLHPAEQASVQIAQMRETEVGYLAFRYVFGVRMSHRHEITLHTLVHASWCKKSHVNLCLNSRFMLFACHISKFL